MDEFNSILKVIRDVEATKPEAAYLSTRSIIRSTEAIDFENTADLKELEQNIAPQRSCRAGEDDNIPIILCLFVEGYISTALLK
jgi:hypothetical protein